ncbi:MAG TPA: hypothetical protein VMG60_11795 [Burkholderiaceae bacterium]|nr:hypothetical protein [Burkholderiaceae bacterium]
MTRISIRSIAGVLAITVTATILQGIASLAHVDSPASPVVTLPAVTVVANKPQEEQPVLASSVTDGAM